MPSEMADFNFVLIHSPLVGPYTWALVGEELHRIGLRVATPELDSAEKRSFAYWDQHASAVADELGIVSTDTQVILVAHSGAGPLLPAIRQKTKSPVAAYIFVDAGWPQDGKSRLELFGDEEEISAFRHAAVDGLLPTWTDEDLYEVIPDDAVRARFVSELTPLPLEAYEEPLPVFPGWPDAPCGYIRFGENPAYDEAFRTAERLGCETLRMEGGHFHMLVEPKQVTQSILEIAARLVGRENLSG